MNQTNCNICQGKTFVDLEERLRMPCPVCDTPAALASLMKAMALVDALVAFDRGEWAIFSEKEGKVELRRIRIKDVPRQTP